MPISLTIDQDLSKATAWTKAVQKQLPFATKNAVNEVAFHARAALNSGTKGAFHVPVKFTQSAFFTQKAKDKRNVIAFVYAKDDEGKDRARYLRFGIAGGSRPPKGFEVYLRNNVVNTGGSYFMPTSLVKTNASGNITTATLRKITAGIDKGEFFAGTPRGGNRPAGIYRRLPQVLQPYLIATSARPSYTGRFNIEAIGTKVIQRKFGAEFDKALSAAMRTAK
jgi:hypothetical protein